MTYRTTFIWSSIWRSIIFIKPNANYLRKYLCYLFGATETEPVIKYCWSVIYIKLYLRNKKAISFRNLAIESEVRSKQKPGAYWINQISILSEFDTRLKANKFYRKFYREIRSETAPKALNVYVANEYYFSRSCFS